jgi:hypothetical protein
LFSRRAEEELTHAAIVAATIQSIADESRQLKGWGALGTTEWDETVHRHLRPYILPVGRYPANQCVLTLTEHMLKRAWMETEPSEPDNGLEADNEEEAATASDYFAQRVHRAPSTDGLMPSLITMLDSYTEDSVLSD